MSEEKITDSKKSHTVCPSLTLGDEQVFLLRASGKVIAYVNSDTQAMTSLNAIACDHVKTLQKSNVKVFRQDIDDKIIISTQVIGHIFHGSVSRIVTYDFIKVTKAVSKVGVCEIVDTRA